MILNRSLNRIPDQPWKVDGHLDVRNFDPDFGPGMTWCARCDAVYGTSSWGNKCIQQKWNK